MLLIIKCIKCFGTCQVENIENFNKLVNINVLFYFPRFKYDKKITLFYREAVAPCTRVALYITGCTGAVLSNNDPTMCQLIPPGYLNLHNAAPSGLVSVTTIVTSGLLVALCVVFEYQDNNKTEDLNPLLTFVKKYAKTFRLTVCNFAACFVIIVFFCLVVKNFMLFISKHDFLNANLSCIE